MPELEKVIYKIYENYWAHHSPPRVADVDLNTAFSTRMWRVKDGEEKDNFLYTRKWTKVLTIAALRQFAKEFVPSLPWMERTDYAFPLRSQAIADFLNIQSTGMLGDYDIHIYGRKLWKEYNTQVSINYLRERAAKLGDY